MRGDMIQNYKVMNGLVRIEIDLLFSPMKFAHTRGHPQRVFKCHAQKLQRINSFSQRVINNWNSLPMNVIQAPSLNDFKEKLDEVWKDLHYEIYY